MSVVMEKLPRPPYTKDSGETNNGYQPDSELDIPSKGTDDIRVDVDTNIDGTDKPEQQDDPWKISKVYIKVVPWHELSTCGKVKRILWDYFGKIVLLVAFLYMFICSLDFLSNAFRLIGGRAAGSIFAKNELLQNPVVGLMMGILATVLFQSSSTTTSVVVSMVAAEILDVRDAIPLIMGANIGTSVTNTIVSIGQITNKNDFRRAFAGATVHDMFNWLSVSILLPLEVATGYLYKLTGAIVQNITPEKNEDANKEFLKKLTSPFTHLIIQVNKKVIQQIAHGDPSAANKSIIKHCCKSIKVNVTKLNSSVDYNTNLTWNYTYEDSESTCIQKCHYLFEGVADKWGDTTVGIVLLIMALAILCSCLVGIVKTLNSLLKGRVSMIIKKFVNSDFPGKLSYFTGYIAIVIGMGLTILVQSSSVFTSALTPLVGIGVVSIERMYPLTLGSNIGTTTTAILAALAQDNDAIKNALQIAFCHLFFNISGILLFFPIPYLRFPIGMAKFLGNQTAKYRWFAAVYLISLFFLFPGAVFGLSIISWIAMAAVFGPIALILLVVLIINVLQKKAPNCLPEVLRNWYFLPEVLRSLKPYDKLMHKMTVCCPCCKAKEGDHHNNQPASDH